MDTQNLQLASTKSRLIAFVIDDLSITLVVFLLLWNKINLANGDLVSIMIITNEAFFQIITLKFLYQTFFVWYYGATIGKIVTKIKVIDFDNFGKVSLVNSAVRAFGRIISESIFYIGFLIAFFTESRQTLHDKFGKTLVVNA
ncbi:MAG: RDD family protein [Campylobacterota bacterium]|nr:RDD family protein [Campylobacterota bacterium]